jgi:nitrogen-specific signal transduction histidine kinase/ActR/RegA family two-component response regulator
VTDAQPEPTNDPIVAELSRWRQVLTGAVLVIMGLVIVGFSLERLTTRWVLHSGNVIRLVTAAEGQILVAEAAVRALLLRPDVDTVLAQSRAARSDSARVLLRALRDSISDHPPQVARVDSVLAALDRWEATFASPVRSGATLTRALALEGTIAFDDLAHPFEEFIREEATLRVERFRMQSRVLWSIVIVIFACLFGALLAGRRIVEGLRVKAIEAAEHQRVVEEQATELEQQTHEMEEQAAQLEEQAALLEEKVAERDSTLALLEETSRFLDSAIDSSPYGIAFYDRRLRFQRINKALADINGAPPAAHLGKTIEEMIPALAPTLRPILEKVLNTGEPITNLIVEGVTPAAPAALKRWSCTYYPIPAAGNLMGGVGCIIVDVTEQHRLEQQLRQSQKLEAVGRLAGGIAHDFNNVLTVIQSYAEVLSFELEERQMGREEVEAIRAAADRAAGLARQLLAFSRRDVIIPRDVDVREVILGMQLILRRLIPTSVELVLDLDERALIVRIDAGQLEQVLMNLAINAVDAMPSGGRLTVSTRPGPLVDDSKRTLLLRVTDSGTGMSAEVQERLFEPFFTTKPAGRGTGLGLATSYAIVHESGGSITVDSQMGRGSTFDVLLPLSDADVADRQRRSTPVRGIDVSTASERILLAEDEPAIRTALSRILRSAGYQVLEAAHGGEALRLSEAESGTIHLLLSDVMMPGVGGKELVQRLAVARPEIRVVMMSGYTDDEALRADLGAARYAFLQKPFTARDVLRVVRSALDAVI